MKLGIEPGATEASGMRESIVQCGHGVGLPSCPGQRIRHESTRQCPVELNFYALQGGEGV
jgi:hypothetical protein